MTPQFDSFRDFLLHCFKCRERGDNREALRLIDEYLNDPQAARPYEHFWSDHNIQQALGFRIVFVQDVNPGEATLAEEKHLGFCQHRLRYWLSAVADSSARLALAQFEAGDRQAGEAAAKEAIRVAGLLGVVSAGVADAAAKAREGEAK
jgi:hypothetical protein